VVLGASFDTPAENLAFAEAQGFEYSLLADVDRSVGRSYEVERAAGERYDQYPRRVAYLIDPNGIVARSYDVSDVAGFANGVLDDLARLQEDSPT
jgi:thioredoxin-dependent peroxiredoxin